MKHSGIFSCSVLVSVVIASCSSSKITAKHIEQEQIERSYFQGFVLYDPATKEQLVNYNGSKYFTPASNTKLFTFYTAYRILKDSIKALEYARFKDSLLIRGTADPSFLYGSDSSRVVDFLKSDSASVYLVDATIDEPVLGSGWSWDDFPYGYMPEKSLFPMYGNLVKYKLVQDSMVSSPPYFERSIQIKDTISSSRNLNSNTFFIARNDTLKKRVPFKTSTQLTAILLGELLNKNIKTIADSDAIQFETFYSVARDSLLKEFLVVSDNLIGEQLLLQVGKEVSGYYNVDSAIAYSKAHLLKDIPQPPRWVDGSGLSRYNLFTPESIVWLLEKMNTEIQRDRLLNFFPVGGRSGTLKNWYGNASRPYVYAKSGTLSNNYNLSGYLITEKGRFLIFSCMMNHFKEDLSVIKTEIEDLLFQIYKTY